MSSVGTRTEDAPEYYDLSRAALQSRLRQRKQLSSAGSRVGLAHCDCDLAVLYIHARQFSRADEHLSSATTGFTATRRHHHLANVQWIRAQRLLAESRDSVSDRHTLMTEAIDTAISSWIASEHERFQFADSESRLRWAQVADRRLATLLALAYEHGEPALVADLIEYGINAGLHSVDAEFGDERCDLGLDEDARSLWSTELIDHSEPDVGHGPLVTETRRSEEAAVRLLNSNELAMEPPAALRATSADGSTRWMLGVQRAMAARLDPELETLFKSVPTVDAW